jgi:hypothetical protein
MRHATTAALFLLLLCPSLAMACDGGDSTAPPAIVTSTALPPTRPPAATGPGAAVTAVVRACREKNAAALRSYIPDDVTGAEIAAMFARGSDVQLLSQSVPDTSEDSARIDVSLRVTSDAGEEIVQQTWQLERIEGSWKLTELPECY